MTAESSLIDRLKAENAHLRQLAVWCVNDFWQRGDLKKASEIARSFGLPDPAEHELKADRDAERDKWEADLERRFWHGPGASSLAVTSDNVEESL
jgi:hypothetical protein